MKIFIVGFGAKNRPTKTEPNPPSTGKDYLSERLTKELGLTFE